MGRRLLLRLLLAFAATLSLKGLSGPPAFAQSQQPLTVFAAASLQDAMKEAGAAYTRRGGGPVTFSFAGSSILARQIEQGAHADLFVSADLQWMDYLAERRLIRPETRANLASARLVLVAPSDSKATLPIRKGFPLARALGEGRLSLADPDSVPAGIYAKAALTSLGVWDQVAAKVAKADNVRSALSFVARGEAPFGIVYDTDAKIEPGVRIVGVFPEASHPKILYPAAMTSSGSPDASAFLRFLRGPQAMAVLRRYGFTIPR